MSLARVGEIVKEDFTVTDDNFDPIIGLNDSDFTKMLYDSNSNEVTSTVIVTITELGNGNYRAEFCPTSKGIWYLIVYHDTYFPWGKANNIKVMNNDSDTLGDLIVRILGLTQENFYIDNATHDVNDNLIGGRIRIYDDSSNVGTDSGVIATYHITATYNDKICKTYKVIKI